MEQNEIDRDNMLLQMVKSKSGFPVLDEERAYKRYMQVWHRKVQFPNGSVDWDIAGHDIPNPCFCVVFPYFTKTKTTTLILEYMQGINGVRYGMTAGGFDARKHKSLLETAQQVTTLII